MIKAEPITGNFVLSALDGEFEFDESENAIFKPSCTVYFESDVGEGKAKYWTDNLENAFVFTDMDSAISMLKQVDRKHSPVSILQVTQS
ncbi:hypothetical protein [Vibrio furnissii]|uniref:hypothetical protein n=1 Tax=Vibrio furnissii TaxID=29494 RepID=UPI001EE9F354|nr:hypothetical protein [Vibrio furnissii]MCG6230218.1 hypothetical protein [Vibrio furnissii]MCG6268487.1 hypothetical protein [Vibrio furnissii]